jgi:hypothetical protein
MFIAGFDLDSISQEYSNILNNFFSNPQNISFSLGGNQSSTFGGNMLGEAIRDSDLSERLSEKFCKIIH